MGLREVIVNKKIRFEIDINAPREVVWDTMLGLETFKVWTGELHEGTYYKGSWGQGDKIQFLVPGEDGMTAVIAESRPHEYVSIRYLGEISKGVEDTTSEKVRAWAPAYENYTFLQIPEGTKVQVDLDVRPEDEEHMRETYPKGLQKLKEICEKKSRE